MQTNAYKTNRASKSELAGGNSNPTKPNGHGNRNRLLILMLYNTGARVSELTAILVKDVQAADNRQVLLHGKGRKERIMPLWPETKTAVRRWIKENRMTPELPLLPGRFGQPLTRSGVAWNLRRIIQIAQRSAPSLETKRISPHTFRHTTAMHLLQSGVAHEVISLWLGHESPSTTHLYVEADLEMKQRTIDAIHPNLPKKRRKQEQDQLLRFLQDNKLC